MWNKNILCSGSVPLSVALYDGDCYSANCTVSGVHFLTNEKGCWDFYIGLGYLWRMFAHRASKSGSTVKLPLCAPY